MYNTLVSTSMRRNRFLEIARNLHCADNNSFDHTDKMYKLRPLIEKLQIEFKKASRPEPTLSYDESMIAYYRPHSCKQYIRGKPIRFRYKVWSLNFLDGFLVDFKLNLKHCVAIGADGCIVNTSDDPGAVPEVQKKKP